MWWRDAPGPGECCSGYSCTLAVADGERSRPEQHKGYSMWGGGASLATLGSFVVQQC